jgi:hypothetical protein
MRKSFDLDVAKAVESAVIEEFGFYLQEIVGLPDTRAKKITVAVLNGWFHFPLRAIGEAYRITCPFIPTVTDDIMTDMLRDPEFRKAVYRVVGNARVFVESQRSAA